MPLPTLSETIGFLMFFAVVVSVIPAL